MNDSTLTFLDTYCERAGGADFWAEPLNAITNIAFIIAGVLAVRALLRLEKSRTHLDAWLLAALLIAIGVGSGLWHTHATEATMLADVIPIVAFMNVYLLVFLRRILALSWLRVLIAWLGFQAANVASEIYLPRDFLNGSVMYLPTYLTLLVLTVCSYKINRHAGKTLELAMMVFTASLFLRTLDNAFCVFIPVGTHFLWHLCNAYLLYRLLMLVIPKTNQQAG